MPTSDQFRGKACSLGKEITTYPVQKKNTNHVRSKVVIPWVNVEVGAQQKLLQNSPE